MHGHRFGWLLASPLSPLDYERFVRWITGQKTGIKGGLLSEVGIKADEKCLHWNCAFFVPFCVKGRDDEKGKPGRVCKSEWIGLTSSKLDPEKYRSRWEKVDLSKDRDHTPMRFPSTTDHAALPQGENFPAWLLSRLYGHMEGRARKLAGMTGGRNAWLYGDAADLGRDVLVIEHYHPGVLEPLQEEIRQKLLQAVAEGAVRHGIEHNPDKDDEAVDHGFRSAEDAPWGQAWLESRLSEYRQYVKDAEILNSFRKRGVA